MSEDVKKELIDSVANASIRRPRYEDILDSQQRDEDERGSNCFHVGRGLSTVCLFQFGYQNPDNIQEKEKVHLDRWMEGDREKYMWLKQIWMKRMRHNVYYEALKKIFYTENTTSGLMVALESQ